MTDITLNPDQPFEKVLIEMVLLHRAKGADYAGADETGNDPFQNFYDVAYQLSLTPGHDAEHMIATKQARLRVLMPRFWNKTGKPRNESIRDTLKDRAVYSVIAVALFDEGSYEGLVK